MSCSVMEFGWRVGLYEQYETTQADFMARLLNRLTEKDHLTLVEASTEIIY